MFGTGIDNTGFESGVSNLQATANIALGNIAADMVSHISSAAAQIPQQMVSVGSAFEASMSQVAATMGITAAAEEFDILSDAAKKMGETTKFSAAQAAEALNYLALAGYDAEKAVAALPTVLNVAAAGGMDLAYASDLITDAMSALGLETAQMATFADQLAVTAQKSNTSVSQLGEAILTVGGTAKTLSGGVVEMNTALGILADNGIKGAEGGTALRNVILSLSAPTNTAAQAMERLGVTAFDASGTMRPLEDTFADLNTALSELTDQEKTAVLNEIFNKVDLKSVNALLGTSAERFDQLSEYISDCSNAAAEMAKTMDDNLKGDITILDSALEGLGIAAYEKFQEPFREAVQEVTGYVGVLTTELTDGELSGSVDKIAEGFNNLADAALRVVGDTIIPMIVSGFEAIVEYGSEIISIAAGIGAAFAAWKITNIVLAVIASIQTANLQLALLAAQTGAAAISQTALAGGLTLTEIAVALFTGKLTLATAATAAFNAVCSVNPIVLVVTALAAAAVALTTFALTADTTHNKLKKINEEMEKISETTENSISSSQAEIAVIEAKMRKYEELRREYELTGKGEENLKVLAEDLQQYMPDEIQLIDEQTGAYNSLAGSIENVSKSLLKKASISAYEEQYAELIKQKIEAEKILNEASSELADQSWFVGDFFNAVDYNEALKTFNDIESQIWEVEAELNKLHSQDTTIHIGAEVQYELGGTTVGYKSSSQMAAEEYANQRAKEAEELIALQDDINEKLKNKWSALEHNYAIGVIASEEELYQKKQELLDKYGNENLEAHWQYYEDLFGYQQSYAEESQQEYEQWIQDEWNSISHLQSLGLISSEQAYQQQLEFISKYCSEYSDEWHSYYQTIIDYQREAQQEQVEGVRDSLSETVNEYKSAFSELESSVNSYKNRLLSVGDLISIVTETDKDGNETTTYSVENLQKQMNAMHKYHDYIRQLKERDASEEILSELTSYDFEDSFYLAENFAKMSDAEFNKINKLYAQREQLASDLADELYAPEMEQLNTDLINGVIAEFGTLPEEIRSIGAEALASFIEGISQTENLSEKVSEFTDSFFNACNEGISEGFAGIDIADSIAATLAEQDTYAIGKEKGDALVNGFNDALNALYAQFNSEQAYMSASVSYKQQPYQSASGSSSAGTSQAERIVLENYVDTTVQLDSEKIGKVSYKYIKEFERKSDS
ncbi:MAG: phage tail tape measure protein [Oscillospiraceae bacterium]|nr:phage tail tape measure protein [Oscillospiraceae bacterium]